MRRLGAALPCGRLRFGLRNRVVSVHVFQEHSSGAFSPYLSVFGAGPEHASTAIAGGQPLATSQPNVVVALIGGMAAVERSSFVVHVTGHCGAPFVATL
jgi:hypothetical protein